MLLVSKPSWLDEYGGPGFAMPEIAGRYAGKSLVIVGDALCVWDDLAKFGCAVRHRRGEVGKSGWDFLTINKIVETFPGNIEHAYSNDGAALPKFVEVRRQEYRTEFGGPAHTHSCNKGAKWRWPWGGWGTSGLGGCFVGKMLGYDRAVIVGMPLDESPHNGEPPWRHTNFTREAPSTEKGNMNKHWLRARDAWGGKLKSMSGRTREWLGSPENW